MKRLFLPLAWVILSSFSSLSAQDVVDAWSLDRCIKHAFDKNITVQQALISYRISSKNFTQSKLDLLPTINANASQNFNYGNSLDPTTFQFIRDNSQSTQFSGNANLVLFSGFQKMNNISRSKNEMQTAEASIEAAKYDIALTITNLYLNVLFNKELLRSAEEQLLQASEQLKQTKELVEAGAMPRANLLDADALVAQREAAYVQAENAEDLSLLSLALGLQLDNPETFDVLVPTELDEVDSEMGGESAKQVFLYAIDHQPSVKVSELRLMTSQKDLSLSRGSLYPTVSFNSRVSTNYFNSRFLNTEFGEQLQENLAESVSFNLSIPIFQGWSRMTAVQVSKLNILNSQLNLKTTQDNLKNEVYQAHANAKAAWKSYNASNRQVEALRLSYENAKVRFEAGAINSLEFQTVQSNLSVAESDQIRAKYDYLFKLKVLDYYQGKPIGLN